MKSKVGLSKQLHQEKIGYNAINIKTRSPREIMSQGYSTLRDSCRKFVKMTTENDWQQLVRRTFDVRFERRMIVLSQNGFADKSFTCKLHCTH